MIYLSAGHNTQGPKKDPGAVNNKGVRESDLTIELRELVEVALRCNGANFITDKDDETLSQYVSRIQPGDGSVVCEFHFNSSNVITATGCEVIYKKGGSAKEKALAAEISAAIANVCGLKNRGAKDETTSHRGRLAILHTGAGISVLPEMCFISNPKDLMLYHQGKARLAVEIAAILKKYDDMVK